MGISQSIASLFFKCKDNNKVPVLVTAPVSEPTFVNAPEHNYALLFDQICQETPVKKVSFEDQEKKVCSKNIYSISIFEYMYLYLTSLWERIWKE